MSGNHKIDLILVAHSMASIIVLLPEVQYFFYTFFFHIQVVSLRFILGTVDLGSYVDMKRFSLLVGGWGPLIYSSFCACIKLYFIVFYSFLFHFFSRRL